MTFFRCLIFLVAGLNLVVGPQRWSNQYLRVKQLRAAKFQELDFQEAKRTSPPQKTKVVAVFTGGGIRASIGTAVVMDLFDTIGFNFDEYHALSGGTWGLMMARKGMPSLCGNELKEKLIGPSRGTTKGATSRDIFHWLHQIQTFVNFKEATRCDQVEKKIPAIVGVENNGGELAFRRKNHKMFWWAAQQHRAGGLRAVGVYKTGNGCYFQLNPQERCNLEIEKFGCLRNPFETKGFSWESKFTERWETKIIPQVKLRKGTISDAKTEEKGKIDMTLALASTLSADAPSTNQSPAPGRNKPSKLIWGEGKQKKTVKVTDGGDFNNLMVHKAMQDFLLDTTDTDYLVYGFDFSGEKNGLLSVLKAPPSPSIICGGLLEDCYVQNRGIVEFATKELGLVLDVKSPDSTVTDEKFAASYEQQLLSDPNKCYVELNFKRPVRSRVPSHLANAQNTKAGRLALTSALLRRGRNRLKLRLFGLCGVKRGSFGVETLYPKLQSLKEIQSSKTDDEFKKQVERGNYELYEHVKRRTSEDKKNMAEEILDLENMDQISDMWPTVNGIAVKQWTPAELSLFVNSYGTHILKYLPHFLELDARLGRFNSVFPSQSQTNVPAQVRNRIKAALDYYIARGQMCRNP